MIPRWRPALDPAARLRALVADPDAARARVSRALSIPAGWDVVPYPDARTALLVHLRQVARERPGSTVLVPAQVCAIVPRVIERAGLVPRFVDLAPGHTTAGPDELLRALRDDVAAVLVAPQYGHLPRGWASLLATGVPVIVDAAQHPASSPALDPLLRGARAAVWSFGLGKGVDTGGGLLASAAPVPPDDRRTNGAWTGGEALARALALRGAIGLGVYRFLVPRLDAALEAQSHLGTTEPCALPARAFALWAPRLERLRREIDLARTRAKDVAALPGLAPLEAQDALHLRQLVRFSSPAAACLALERLRAAGVDACPAGEPLPAGPADAWPEAAAFRATTLRLPFLGRLTAHDHDRLLGALRRVTDALP